MKKALSYLPFAYFGIFLAPLIFNPWAGNEVFEIAKQSLFLAFVCLALAYLACVFLLRREIKIPWSRPVLALAILWICSFAVSTALSIAPIESFWGLYKRGGQGLFLCVFYAMHFLICIALFRHQKYKKAFIGIALAAGLVSAIYAIAQKLNLDPLTKGTDGMFAGRSFAAMGSPSALGQFLIFPWWIALCLMLEKFKAGKAGKAGKKSNWSLGFYLALLILFSAALYFSFNRASILGICIMAAVFLITQIKFPKGRAVCLIVLAALAGGVYMFSLSPNALSTRSLGSRAVLWESAVRLIPEYPVFGSGPETTYQTIQKTLSPKLYYYERMLDIPDRVHNVLLEALLERGVVGLLILAGTVVFIIQLVLRKRLKNAFTEAGFFSLASYFIAVHFGFSSITHVVFLTAMAALLCSSLLQFKRIQWKPALAVRLFLIIVLAAFAFLAGSHSYKMTRAEFETGEALKSYFFSDPGAIQKFTRAWEKIPYFREIPYMTFFLFIEQSKTDPTLLPYLEKAQQAITKISNNGLYGRLTRAELEMTRHNYFKMQEEFSAAAKLAPNWPGVWHKWGNALQDIGMLADAREKYEKFLLLAPKFAPADRELERVFMISNPVYFEVKSMVEILPAKASLPSKAG